MDYLAPVNLRPLSGNQEFVADGNQCAVFGVYYRDSLIRNVLPGGERWDIPIEDK